MLTFGEHQITPFQKTLLIREQNVPTDVDISVAQGASPSFEGAVRLHFTYNTVDGPYTKNSSNMIGLISNILMQLLRRALSSEAVPSLHRTLETDPRLSKPFLKAIFTKYVVF